MEEVTRDFLEGPTAAKTDSAGSANREALKNIFDTVDMTGLDWHQEEPDQEYFARGRELETLPDLKAEVKPLPRDRKIKVFSEYPPVNDHLKHERFEIVANPAQADVLWMVSNFKDYK